MNIASQEVMQEGSRAEMKDAMASTHTIVDNVGSNRAVRRHYRRSIGACVERESSTPPSLTARLCSTTVPDQ